ncbi:MAG: hypothetical protein ABFD66_00430 [Smithella sp.]
MTEREYDDLYNEGAEGFNPYRASDNDDSEPLWSKIESRIAKIQRLLNGLSDNAFDQPRAAQLKAEQEELEAIYAKIR